MPKIIELTVELDVERVSCPGVWLCQDGRVSLTIFALGTSYQTCMLPPIFPLEFRDVFYFRKRFEETCSLSNIVCLLKDETIYCELVQWCQNCANEECMILAQYLGALNDVLFPPNMCSSDGVDLLMRRSKEFPGILSPKIEITTKVRIDEVWNSSSAMAPRGAKIRACSCSRQDCDPSRQKPVCHTTLYHRVKCGNKDRPRSPARSRSRSRSGESRSCSSLLRRGPDKPAACLRPSKARGCHSARTRRRPQTCNQFQVYRTEVPRVDTAWRSMSNVDSSVDASDNDEIRIRQTGSDRNIHCQDKDEERLTLQSRYIDVDLHNSEEYKGKKSAKINQAKISPCVCEICKRYHELFHVGTNKS